MEEALDFLAPYGPDLLNGMTNHAPMAVEALAVMDRADAVMPWLDRYRTELAPRPPVATPIAPPVASEDWRAALGRFERTGDWLGFFAREVAEAPWRDVLARWTVRLAPAMCASATHGPIRVGHAARALADAESPRRIAELGDALAAWAATYQTLPSRPGDGPRLPPRDAIAAVPLVPPAERVFTGTIVSSLEALGGFAPFAPVAGLLDVSPEPARVLSGITDTFARVYLANARDFLTAIVFVHGVTGVAALRPLLPHLDPEPARAAVRYAWQSSCGLYATFGVAPPATHVDPPRENAATLADMAIRNGDEHAIKFTGACLGEHALNPSPAYLAAARHAIGALVAP
jgi:hypothetical protein